MRAIAEHLVKRAVYEFHAKQEDGHGHDGKVDLKVNGWALVLVVLTVFIFIVAVCAVQYTYGQLVATLAAVEAPTTTVILRTAPEDNVEGSKASDPLIPPENKDGGLRVTVDEEVLLIKEKPLTARFSTIRRHLEARCGRHSRFRGVYIHVLESFLLSIFVGSFTFVAGDLFGNGMVFRTCAEILAVTCLTNFSLLWNHYVISEPSEKSWYQRFPTIFEVRKAYGPTAANAAIQRFSALGYFYALTYLESSTKTSGNRTATYSFLACTVALFLGLFLILGIAIPSEIAITRVRASLLAAEETPVIPFDRIFGGQVVPTSAGGTGILGLWQAWAGTDRQTRLRVLGVYLKTIGIMISITLLAILTIAAEFKFLIGPEEGRKLLMVTNQALNKA